MSAHHRVLEKSKGKIDKTDYNISSCIQTTYQDRKISGLSGPWSFDLFVLLMFYLKIANLRVTNHMQNLMDLNQIKQFSLSWSRKPKSSLYEFESKPWIKLSKNVKISWIDKEWNKTKHSDQSKLSFFRDLWKSEAILIREHVPFFI